MRRILNSAGRVTKVRSGKQRGIMAISTIYPRNAKTERRNENENAEDYATRDAFADNETTNDGVFHDLTQISDIQSPSHSISNTVLF